MSTSIKEAALEARYRNFTVILTDYATTLGTAAAARVASCTTDLGNAAAALAAIPAGDGAIAQATAVRDAAVNARAAAVHHETAMKARAAIVMELVAMPAALLGDDATPENVLKMTAAIDELDDNVSVRIHAMTRVTDRNPAFCFQYPEMDADGGAAALLHNGLVMNAFLKLELRSLATKIQQVSAEHSAIVASKAAAGPVVSAVPPP